MNWTVEDIKARVSEKKAGLFVCDYGFVVLEIDYEGVSNRKFLNAWIGYFKPMYAKEHEDAIADWLHQMKDACGCEWVQFTSPRRGFIKSKRFKPYMTIFRSYE